MQLYVFCRSIIDGTEVKGCGQLIFINQLEVNKSYICVTALDRLANMMLEWMIN